MYKVYNKQLIRRCGVIKKSVRMDSFTYETIRNVSPDDTFSECLRKLVHEYAAIKARAEMSDKVTAVKT